ncbi:hypothetical protein HU200_002564 [Digitaria exilis]|uniref:C2H2-type domain-containing protein n=1 Tax=Digitaria exilis TaxID=1010633 RepID=A0A835FZB8_9POAL|nr:hypothetical protein HU200_002564 [Digitaria exilis]
MDLSQETSKDDGASARTSSPSGGDQAGDDDKEMQKQRAGDEDEDDHDDDEGTRQPYKCTFCRRGFPTAQALGGHMNVHRRHRGRSSATAPIAAAAAHQGSSSCCYEQHPSTAVVAFGQTHPATATSLSERKRPYELHLFGRDDCAAAGGGRRGNKEGDVRRDRCYARDDGDCGGDHGGGEAELDLELRLGP